MIQEIMKIVEDHGYHISHCFREANKPADKLASLSHGAEEIHVFNSFSSLPKQVRGLINMDRWEFPSFRMKPVKPSYLVYEPP
ncbi:hypothetical protein MTR67_011688 [Solanum verrucosum]|uniref:RNase H type-1 domain-containing protein n=1 Tax=Solanum verrucosum TaxID=315347 RepID=A0AAF0Q8X3_SOLVR|nr:hypothetical protein MTR67_011688 [Solanum verrucosum]